MYPYFTLPEDKNVECVRIELKDLRELPRKYWYLGNNSFLLHGFSITAIWCWESSKRTNGLSVSRGFISSRSA